MAVLVSTLAGPVDPHENYEKGRIEPIRKSRGEGGRRSNSVYIEDRSSFSTLRVDP